MTGRQKRLQYYSNKLYLLEASYNKKDFVEVVQEYMGEVYAFIGEYLFSWRSIVERQKA